MSIFQHTKVPVPDDCKFGISPSSIGKFFDNPVIWYKENILGEELFVGSTATVRGTCAHYMAECAATKTPLDYDALEQELLETNIPDVDYAEVLNTYKDLGNLFVDYVNSNTIDEVERQLCAKVKDGIYVKGSNDARQGSTIIDYKTSSKKPSGNMPFGYFIQMMAYAYMYRAEGTHIDRLRLVYATAATKTLPPRQFVVTHVIQEEDWDMISQTLELIADSVLLHFSNPELDYITFKSMQFKQKEKPLLFK